MNAVVQFGLKPTVMGATGYRCTDGPADGQVLLLCDGDVLVVGRQPPGVNAGDPFIAVSVSPRCALTLRQFSTYRGEYELRDGELRWTEEYRPARPGIPDAHAELNAIRDFIGGVGA